MLLMNHLRQTSKLLYDLFYFFGNLLYDLSLHLAGKACLLQLQALFICFNFCKKILIVHINE